LFFIFQDIQEFQNFVQKSGGHSGGWTNADHLLFCKLLQKKKGPGFIAAVLEQMPGTYLIPLQNEPHLVKNP